jgi:hypothetical protein
MTDGLLHRMRLTGRRRSLPAKPCRPMIAYAGLLLALPAIAAAPSSVLRAEVEGNTVVIYSSMKKAGGCKASVMFSYRTGDRRQVRKLECNFRVPAQDHYRFCEHSNLEFVDLKLEGRAIGGCE